LQYCIEEYLFDYYDGHEEELGSRVQSLRTKDLSVLPEEKQKALIDSLNRTLNTFDLVAKVRTAEKNRLRYAPEYRPQHQHVRGLQSDIRNIRSRIEKLNQNRVRMSRSDSPEEDEIARIEEEIADAEASIADLKKQIPESWEQVSKRYNALEKAEEKARRDYRNNVDRAYETIAELREFIAGADELAGMEQQLTSLAAAVSNEPAEAAMERIKEAGQALGKIAGTSTIKTQLSKARRAIRGETPEPDKAIQFLAEGFQHYAAEVEWRRKAAPELAPALASYDDAVKNSIGLRLQRRMTPDQVKAVARCRSVHRDYSLQF
jgi:chromosome segregation ATPase